MADVAVIVPTLRRPESLERALRSLFAQTGVADRIAAVVVVDNDPLGSALPGVTALRPLSPWPLAYVSEPTPGVARARNAGLAATDAPLVRRPKNKFDAVVERRFGERFSAGAEVVAADRADDIAGTTLAGYAILNLRASCAIDADWRVTGRVENLFDRDYALVRGYSTPGLAGFLEIVWQPAAR